MSLTYGYTSLDGVKELIKQIESIKGDKKISSFLDLGSGDGIVVNYMKELSNIKRCVGIEIQQKWHDIAISKYPHLELYHGDALQHQELLSDMDVIYMNNLCFDNELTNRLFSLMKEGSIIIQNNQSIALQLKKKGYNVKNFYMEANLMNKETSIHIKKITET